MQRLIIGTLFAFLGMPLGLIHAANVKEVVVFENTKTTDETVKYIANVDEGDDVGPEDLQKIKERLVSSGLFKEVEVYTSDVAGGVRVNLEAKDKHSWAVAPTYYNQPTNKGFGFGFGENNLFGENKKLLLYGQIATGETFFLGALINPNMWNTPLKSSLDVYLRSARIFEFNAPTEWIEQTEKYRKSRMRYLNAGISLGANFFRVISLDFRLRGAHVKYTETEVVDDPDGPAPPEPGDEGWDISGDIDLKISTIGNWYGVSSGTRLSLSYEKGLEPLGSDFDYYLTSAHLTKAIKFFKKTNLILKTGVLYGQDLPFQQEFTSGGTGLRGYKGNQFRGDFKVSGSAEYSFELVNIKGVALRLLGFYDSAYTRFLDGDNPQRNYLDGHDIGGTAPWRNSVGVGTRLYIRQLVLPLLGVDVGYALEAGAVEFFLAIGLTDV